MSMYAHEHLHARVRQSRTCYTLNCVLCYAILRLRCWFSLPFFKYDLQCFRQRYSSMQYESLLCCVRAKHMSQCSHTHVLARSTDWAKKTHSDKSENAQCSHRILKCLKNTERNTCTCAHTHIKKQHICTYTQSRSLRKSEVTPPPVHARNMQRAWRKRESGRLGERKSACTGSDRSCDACYGCAVPMPSAKAHKVNGI